MALYRNEHKNSPITAVEFAPTPEGNLSFFHLKDAASTDSVKQWLAGLGQEITAESTIHKQPVLVTRGTLDQHALMKAMTQHGDPLALEQQKPKFNPWAWRGNLSMAGQLLQLTSGLLSITPKKDTSGTPFTGAALKDINNFDTAAKKDMGTVTFAVSNIAANTTNIMFGAEKAEDVHRLRFLKKKINERLSGYLPDGDTLPTEEEKCAELRKEPEQPKSAGEKTNEFIKANSVRVGEIGLRYLGAFGLAFPLPFTDKAKAAWKGAAQEPGKAYDKLKAPDPANRKVGLAYLFGKTIALFSKVPDPYDPKPHGIVDTIREKVLFRLSSLIEGAAAAYLSYDRLTKKYVNVRGTPVRDWFGALGGALFTIGLAIRLFAPFGVKEVNMKELYAHITDSIAKIPAEQQPQAIAETAAFLKEHFKEKQLDFGKLYTDLTLDLYRYHTMSRTAGSLAENKMAMPIVAGEIAAQMEALDKSMANDSLKRQPIDMPPATHADRATMTLNADTPVQGRA